MFILEQYLDHYSFSFPFKIAFMLSYLCIAHILTGYNLHDSMFETWNIYTHTHTYVHVAVSLSVIYPPIFLSD